MIRIKRGKQVAKRRKKYFNLAKGYTGKNSKCSTFIQEQIQQSLMFKYISRRLNKRNFRKLWISRINGILKFYNSSYSSFMGKLRKLNILIDRKILAMVAFSDFNLFKTLFNNLE